MCSSECYPWIQGLQARKLLDGKDCQRECHEFPGLEEKNVYDKQMINEKQKYQHTLRILDASKKPKKYPD